MFFFSCQVQEIPKPWWGFYLTVVYIEKPQAGCPCRPLNNRHSLRSCSEGRETSAMSHFWSEFTAIFTSVIRNSWFRNTGIDVSKPNNLDSRQCYLIQSSWQWISCTLGTSLSLNISFSLQDAWRKNAHQECQKYALCYSLFVLLLSHLFAKSLPCVFLIISFLSLIQLVWKL